MARKTRVVLEICLYGARHCGFGYLAMAPARLVPNAEGGKLVGKMRLLGTGEPVAERSLTETIWLAVAELKEAGAPLAAGVAIFDTGGERVAVVPLTNVPAYGDLKWSAAPVFTVTPGEVREAAKKEGA